MDANTSQEWTIDSLNAEITTLYARIRELEDLRDILIGQERDLRIRTINPAWFYGMELAVIPEVMDYQNIIQYKYVYLTDAFKVKMQVSTNARPMGFCWDMPIPLIEQMRAAWLAKNMSQPGEEE